MLQEPFSLKRKTFTKKKDEIIELFNKGLKQRDIAEQVGVDKSYVSKVVKEFT